MSVACSVCLSGTSQQKEDRLSEAEFQALVARLPRFGKQKEYLVYEGDLVLTESELRAHLAQVATLRKTRGRNLGEMQPSGQCVVCLKQRFCSTDETEDAVLFTPEQRCSFAIKQRMDKIRSSPAVIREEFKRLQQQIKKGHIDKGTVDLDAAPQDCKLGFWLNNARFYKMKHIELRFAVDSRSFCSRLRGVCREPRRGSALLGRHLRIRLSILFRTRQEGRRTERSQAGREPALRRPNGL